MALFSIRTATVTNHWSSSGGESIDATGQWEGSFGGVISYPRTRIKAFLPIPGPVPNFRMADHPDTIVPLQTFQSTTAPKTPRRDTLV